jgi:Ca-activated chloride channel family protein
MPRTPSHYEILGVPTDATPEEIRHAYRAMSRQAHPDVNPKRGANTQFLSIQEAYETLFDPSRRQEYDERLAEGRSEPVSIDIQYSRSKIQAIDEPQLIYAYLNIRAAPKFLDQTNPALNLCIVLDHSTSMKGTRLDTVKAAAIEVVRQTRTDDVISIISFSDRADVLLPADRKHNRNSADTQIRLIRASGGTEIFQGLEAAYQQIQRYLNRSMVNHIILITDGHTYGDEIPCLDLAENCGARGIRITAIGIGTEWNDEFLDELTNRTGGSTFFISNALNLHAFVQEKLAKLNQVFAERVVLTLKTEADVSIRTIYRIQPDANQLPDTEQIRLGSILKSSDLSLIIEMIVKPVKAEQYRHKLAFGNLSMVLPFDPKETYDGSFQLSRLVGEIVENETPPAEIMHALARITLYRMQERARKEAQAGRIEEATTRLQRLVTQLLSLGEVELAHSTLNEVNRIANTHSLSAEGEKHIKYATRSLLLPSRVLERKEP